MTIEALQPSWQFWSIASVIIWQRYRAVLASNHAHMV